MARTYVKVQSFFDSIGFMQPQSIIWSDGRKFDIERVQDFRPAGNGIHGDCYTVIINGKTRYLYFERQTQGGPRIGRWFVQAS